MENKDKGAFPRPSNLSDNYNGLTKREYFAAMAMQGILSRHIDTTQSVGGGCSAGSPEYILAKESMKYADELLRQLEEGKK